MTNYRLGSSSMISAPGLVRWAVAGYWHEPDRPHLAKVITATWAVPADVAHALLSKRIPYTVDGDCVVFAFEGGEPQRKRFVVSAKYCTKGGRQGSWTFRMGSTWAMIIADAERHVAKHRPGASKLDISAACLD